MTKLRSLTLAAALLALVLPATRAEPAKDPPGKTLTRQHDPVIVPGDRLESVRGKSSARLRLMRFEENHLVAIPFQFDQRDAKGEVVTDEIPEDTVVGPQSELVFMARDTGDRVAPSALPPASDGGIEIEAVDPTTGERGWAYLLHFPDRTPPPSPKSYVNFDPVTLQARSDLYSVDYHATGNFFTGFRIEPTARGSGENLVYRTRMRGTPTFSFLVSSWTPEFTEEDSLMELVGVRNGPVRATRKVKLWVDLGTFFPELPGGTVYTHHYRSSFISPSKVSIPWLVLNMAEDFSFENMTDFREIAEGMRYWDEAHPEGLAFDQRSEIIQDDHDHEWWVASGDKGTFLQSFRIPEKWKDWGVSRDTLFVDGKGDADEEDPTISRMTGPYGAGYRVQRMTDIREPGEYELEMATVVLPKLYEPGDERQALDVWEKPLEIEVHPLEVSPGKVGAPTTAQR